MLSFKPSTGISSTSEEKPVSTVEMSIFGVEVKLCNAAFLFESLKL